jgi:hypothetical protein
VSRPVSARSFRPIRAAMLCLAAIVLATPSARAGLGDLMKKAKEKVAPSQTEAPTQKTPFKLVFDDDVVELAGERLDHILATYQAAAAVSAGRAELVVKLNATHEEREKIWDKDGEKIMEQQRKRGDMDVCYHDGYQAASNRRMQEYSQKALTDPAIREKFTRIAQQNNAAAMQGDSAAIARAQQGMMEEVLATKEDSAAVRKECGPMPPAHASEAKVQALDKQIASLNEQIRAIDGKVAQTQAKQSGLTPHQWGIAIDRIQGFLWQQARSSSGGGGAGLGSLLGGGGGGRGGSSGGGNVWTTFSKVELEALGKRHEQLRKFLGR